jgi:hypothetical protein
MRPSPGIVETRSYDLQYKTLESSYYLKDKISPDGSESCGSISGYFQILGQKLAPSLEAINKIVLEQLDSWSRPSSEVESCYQTKEVPKRSGLSISKMFASDRYVSVKIDFSEQMGDRGNLRGRTVNYDLKEQS